MDFPSQPYPSTYIMEHNSLTSQCNSDSSDSSSSSDSRSLSDSRSSRSSLDSSDTWDSNHLQNSRKLPKPKEEKKVMTLVYIWDQNKVFLAMRKRQSSKNPDLCTYTKT